MLLAYRRGLLKPYYEYGFQSRLREGMVLAMLDAEQAADELETSVTAQINVIAPQLAREKIQEYYSQCQKALSYAAMYKRYEQPSETATEQALASSAENLIKAFKRMKKSGIIDRFDKELEEIQNKAILENKQ